MKCSSSFELNKNLIMVKLQQLKTVLRLLRFSSSSCRSCSHQFAIRRSLRLVRHLLFIVAQNVQQKGTKVVKLASNEYP